MGMRTGYAVLAACLLAISSWLVVRPSIPLTRQPRPDALEYADSAYRLAHGEGYTTTVPDQPGRPTVNPPRYPPGLALLLAPFAVVGHYPANVELGSKLIVVALVWLVALAAWDLAGPWAAVLAVILVAVGSPFARNSARLVMSDALGVALAVSLMPLARRRSTRVAAFAGLLAGYGVVVRSAGAVELACLLVVLPGRRRWVAAAGSAVPVIGLALYQWATFGRPWRTGYSYWLPHLKLFSVAYLTSHPRPGDGLLIPDQARGHLSNLACHLVRCAGSAQAVNSLPNTLFYPLVLSGLLWIVTPPGVALAGWLYGALHWRDGDAAVRFAVLVSPATVVFFALYFYQGARFMAPAAALLVVVSAAGFTRLMARHWPVHGAGRFGVTARLQDGRPNRVPWFR